MNIRIREHRHLLALVHATHRTKWLLITIFISKNMSIQPTIHPIGVISINHSMPLHLLYQLCSFPHLPGSIKGSIDSTMHCIHTRRPLSTYAIRRNLGHTGEGDFEKQKLTTRQRMHETERMWFNHDPPSALTLSPAIF